MKGNFFSLDGEGEAPTLLANQRVYLEYNRKERFDSRTVFFRGWAQLGG